MLGHILVNRKNNEGSLFIPEVDLQLKACPGGRRGWIDVYETDGMHYDRKAIFAMFDGGERPKPIMTQVEWLKKTCKFAQDVEVPLLMIRFAVEAQEKKRKQVEGFGTLLEGMFEEKKGAPLNPLGNPADLKVMERSVHRVRDIMDSREPGEISDAKKYGMAIQIQRWIHQAGGLC
jgi:hypothetical protein